VQLMFTFTQPAVFGDTNTYPRVHSRTTDSLSQRADLLLFSPGRGLGSARTRSCSFPDGYEFGEVSVFEHPRFCSAILCVLYTPIVFCVRQRKRLVNATSGSTPRWVRWDVRGHGPTVGLLPMVLQLRRQHRHHHRPEG